MTIATTLFIVLGLLGMYYVGMIAYDMYADKMSKAESEESREESIDVSGQLGDFTSHDVDRPDEETERRRSFESYFCKGLTPEKISSLMEDAAKGTPNEALGNILFQCYQAVSEPA